MNTNETVTTQTVEHAHGLPALVAGVRNELQAQLAQRAERRALRRDLATYTTPAEIDDLQAILDRYDDSDVAEIRTILARQRAA